MARKKTVKVAGAQMLERKSIGEAAEAVLKMMHRAAKQGAEHLVTPEMILTGYHAKWDREERDAAVDNLIRPACRELGLTLHLGAGNFKCRAGRLRDRPFIQVTVVGPDGELVGVHNKTLPTDGDLKWCRRGMPKDLRVLKLKGLVFGNTICNDFWANPRCTPMKDINVPVILGKKGAKVIFHSIASGHDLSYLDFHTTRMEERAIRAGVWVVSANRVVDPKTPVNAPSGIVGSDGEWRVKAPLKDERMFVGEVPV